jgi:hypothetical protein
MVRKIVVPHTTKYTLDIPSEYLNRRIEILVLPFEAEDTPEQPQKHLRLTTFHCGGKLRDFTRGDAYRETL